MVSKAEYKIFVLNFFVLAFGWSLLRDIASLKPLGYFQVDWTLAKKQQL